MYKFTLLIVLTLVFQVSLLSQCLPEGITFTTQTEINNFQTNYPGCSLIEGNVFIQGSDINNLAGLDSLISIEGNLVIENTVLDNLAGLDSLISVGGSLSL